MKKLAIFSDLELKNNSILFLFIEIVFVFISKKVQLQFETYFFQNKSEKV